MVARSLHEVFSLCHLTNYCGSGKTGSTVALWNNFATFPIWGDKGRVTGVGRRVWRDKEDKEDKRLTYNLAPFFTHKPQLTE